MVASVLVQIIGSELNFYVIYHTEFDFDTLCKFFDTVSESYTPPVPNVQ